MSRLFTMFAFTLVLITPLTAGADLNPEPPETGDSGGEEEGSDCSIGETDDGLVGLGLLVMAVVGLRLRRR